jgi:hypothetical protein
VTRYPGFLTLETFSFSPFGCRSLLGIIIFLPDWNITMFRLIRIYVPYSTSIRLLFLVLISFIISSKSISLNKCGRFMRMKWDLDVTPRFWETEPKPPYVCPGCSNHMYGQQYGEQIQYHIKLQTRIPWVQKKYYRVARKSKRRCVFHRHNRRRGRPSLYLLAPAGTLGFDSNI